MFKKFFITIAFFLITIVGFSSAADAMIEVNGKSIEPMDIKLEIDGVLASTNLPIFAINERTYVPVRFVSENMGHKVIWLQDTFTVEIRADGKKMWFPIGKPQVNLGSGLVSTPDNVMAVLAKLPNMVDQVTYVPVRFISEYLGKKVDWVQETKTVVIGKTSENLDNNTIDIFAMENSESESLGEKPNSENPKTNDIPVVNKNKISLITIDTITEDSSTTKMYFTFDNEVNFSTSFTQSTADIFIPNASPADMRLGDYPSPLKNANMYSISIKDNGILISFNKSNDLLTVFHSSDKKSIIVTDSFYFKGIEITNYNGKNAYLLRGLGKQAYNQLVIENPKRIALDFMDTSLEGDNYKEFNQSIGFVKKLRMSQFVPDKNYDPNARIVRVVLDIAEGVNHPDLRIDTVGDDIILIPEESLYDYFSFRTSGSTRSITIKNLLENINYNYMPELNIITASLPISIPDGQISYNDSLIKDLRVENNNLTINLLRNATVSTNRSASGEIQFDITRVKTGNNSDYFIMIDPGHGGTDPGAGDPSETFYEKDVILPVQRALYNRLIQMGYRVQKTNDTVDSYVPVLARAEMANQLKPDIFISLHANTADSSAANGIEVLYSDKNPNKEPGQEKIAQIFVEELEKITGRKSRGTKLRPDIIVVGKTNMTAVLVEMGFLSNPTELSLLKSSVYQNQMVEGIIAAIERFLGEYR
ncbi:MAG: N-acetylmuramoyl-L-alanine amidase [Firmicutes bacterium]|nr:N-acetylmuramoyl-L-alanine amidase [Bacillota bacterium]